MKQNKYDDSRFFAAYEQMPRSVKGLEGAGEWHAWEALLPELQGKDVLDLGCGFGWHCRYARERGASSATGVDLSEKMLRRAREMTDDPGISYIQAAIEDVRFAASSFDAAISSLALHYVEPFDSVCRSVYESLRPGGTFVFSVEHPIFTSREEQDWWRDGQGNPLHWPVDNYLSEGIRRTSFLTDNVIKYHRTTASYLNGLIRSGFRIRAVCEPGPSEQLLARMPEAKDETRRPMFLLVSAQK